MEETQQTNDGNHKRRKSGVWKRQAEFLWPHSSEKTESDQTQAAGGRRDNLIHSAGLPLREVNAVLLLSFETQGVFCPRLSIGFLLSLALAVPSFP